MSPFWSVTLQLVEPPLLPPLSPNEPIDASPPRPPLPPPLPPLLPPLLEEVPPSLPVGNPLSCGLPEHATAMAAIETKPGIEVVALT